MYEEIIKKINNNNGIITLKVAENKGISKYNLKKLCDDGKLKKIEAGIYTTEEFVYDEFYIFWLKHKDVIFSYNTALYLHNMTERTPSKLDITTRRNNNLSSYNDKINLYRVNDEILNLGKCKIKTPYGNIVEVYNLERTICDIINNKNNMDIEQVNKSIKKCIKNTNFSASKMFEYAKKMKIYDKVKNYMEAII